MSGSSKTAERRDGMDVEAEQKRKRPRPTTPSLAPAYICEVLDNEHLLWEIIKRIGDPPTLVRASLACKQWYRICSHPGLLREFNQRQPRRLLGYFAVLGEDEKEFLLFKENPKRAGDVARFLSVSFPLTISQTLDRRSCVLEEDSEFACVSRFLSSTFPEGPCNAEDYCNDRVLFKFGGCLAICHPLRQKVCMLPPLLTLPYWRGQYVGEYFLLTEDGLSAVHVTVASLLNGFLRVEFARLNGDKWIHDANGVEFEQLVLEDPFCHPALLVNGRIYIPTIQGCLVEVSLEDGEVSIIESPTLVWYHFGAHHLCRAHGPDLFYVHADGHSIQIWLYSQDAWTHYNTIDLPTVFVCSNMPWSAVDWDESRAGWGEEVTIYGVGDAVEFMLIGVNFDDGLYLLDVRSCIVVKVGEKDHEGKGEPLGNRIIPLVTYCPPVFPELREGKIIIKTLEKAIAEENKSLIDQLRPISLDEQSVKYFIETRYLSTANLMWGMDDCLTVLHSVAALPVVEGGQLEYRIRSCRRLTEQWGKYILQTRSLRKKVASVNSVYFQAEINGQTVTWRCSLASSRLFWLQFDVKLLIFYENCLELLLDSVNKLLLDSVDERHYGSMLNPNFQYSETIKRLRSVAGCVGQANV